jgi:hypothetical protein
MGNTKSLGIAFIDQDISGSSVIESSGTLGYTADAQGTVTQATSKATAVTLNKSAGRITLNGAALAGNTAVSFTLNNTYLSNNDVLLLCASAGSVADPTTYVAYVNAVAAGTASITLRNQTATSQSEAVVLNFAIIHCA